MGFKVQTSEGIPFRVHDLISSGDAYEILPGGALQITRSGRHVVTIASAHWSWIEQTD